MNIRYDGVVVAVTGAGHGYGRAIAREFARVGAKVFACDLSAEELKETAESEGSITTAAFDLTAKGAAAGWIRDIEQATGQAVGVLVCNAGGVRGQVMRPIEEVPEEDWHAIFDINTHAAFNLCKAVAPGMKKAKTGRIVTISSGAGLKPSLTGIQAYCSSKHALVGLTRQLSREFGPFGITVNSVAPGFALSNAASIKQFESYGEEGQKAMLGRIAMRRLGEPEDMAHAVMFFASPFASWVTGQILQVDGGS
ncbi:SDR family NAD(P)-dependent oxidoreductase [Falsiroseomonas sp.]|uniref:SDR family NAD(P)-dependent oxidoreductase n=1 Tax=Falsiroseomonas sp. TaxID=2870721 RepID=UPI002719A7BD|nr:SDR family oxidoreductase [Falsiroseomonas sp.]MDO9502068.1 SDR family oxidoreductase [Falsiroseomonas sp.]MDP3417494.1 SDR family oxidoreductase [Falsiroseomonas sp.]